MFAFIDETSNSGFRSRSTVEFQKELQLLLQNAVDFARHD